MYFFKRTPSDALARTPHDEPGGGPVHGSAAAPGWRWHRALHAPHRLAFLLAMGILVASGLWWVVEQAQRAGLVPASGHAVAATVVHAALMCFGFIPLFFAGFLFTAGPRWLGVPGPDAAAIAPGLLSQALGWLLWLAGGYLGVPLAVTGLLLATAGLCSMALQFRALIRASRAPDTLHARIILAAFACGCACLAGTAVAVATGAIAWARPFILCGLWGFVVVVYVCVAHRMIPFFTSGALPAIAPWAGLRPARPPTHEGPSAATRRVLDRIWHPGGVLGLMLGLAVFEALAAWVEFAWEAPPAWWAMRSAVQAAGSLLLLRLALAWGLVQSLKIRLLAMLHLGFLWLGLALGIGAAVHLGAALTGAPPASLAPLHALTMGCLGSLMVAMVTRVTCGHGGRPLVADNPVWALFWLLQLATLARIAAALLGPVAQNLLLAAAVGWAAATTLWGLRCGNWYGRPRADGRPG